ncbi:hypothetical protein C0971_11190 [Bacillus methanolicus]|uniref:hypothetical protein n=1 Tax=Bacillus methanolicus TaxID=1471 RepID=UPI00200F86FB|nr:hypothetical protein [Bacillus methanolicus]UQD52517.1 hypothetical protein C0971_11190 [Bacillus methanolicus]
MKELNVQKKELLMILGEIYDKLEELDSVLHNSITEYKKDFQAEHLKRLSVCEERLKAMELEMDKVEIKEQENYVPEASDVILELGY